jgi:glycosyltransferase involved in cell wall biosynthesis
VIAVSEATRRILTEVEGVPGERITVVHNGMEPLVEPAAPDVARVRAELGIGEDARVCLVTARLHEEKGHLVLFEALPAILAAEGPLVVLLAGEGPHRAMLEAAAARHGLSAHVRFLGRRADVPTLIAAATVVVLPSLAESFGFAALEASYLGKPVVASRSGGLPEVVRDRETGLLAAVGSARELAEAVITVLREPGLAARLASAGRQHARRFTAERMVRGYEAVYDRVVAGHGRPPA